MSAKAQAILLAAFIAMVAACASTSAFADDRELLSCTVKRIDSERLKCYDDLVEKMSEQNKPAASGEAVSVADVLADFSSFQGKTVTVNGTLLMMGQQGVLYAAIGSMTALFVGVERLPKDVRQQIFSKCGAGCGVTVTGKVTSIMMNPGVSALSLTFE